MAYSLHYNHLEFFYPPRTENNHVQLVMCSLFAGRYIFRRKVSVYAELVLSFLFSKEVVC